MSRIIDLTHSKNSGSLVTIPEEKASLTLAPQTGSNIQPDGLGLITVTGESGVETEGTGSTLIIRDKRNLTPFTVGNLSTSSEYQELIPAVAAADASGQSSNILIQQCNVGSGEIVDLTLFTHNFIGVGPELSNVYATIRCNVDGTTIFENISFQNGSSVVIQTAVVAERTVIFKNCTFNGATVYMGYTSGPQAKVAFSGCKFNQFSILEITNCVVQMDNSDFRGVPSVTIVDCNFSTDILVSYPPPAPILQQFMTPISNCMFCGFNLSSAAPVSNPPSFQDCTFQYKAFGVNSIGPSSTSYFTNCRFMDQTGGAGSYNVSFTNSNNIGGNYVFQGCYFRGCSISAGGDGASLVPIISFRASNCTFENCDFIQTYSPNDYRFTYCDIQLRAQMVFRNILSTDTHILRYCNIRAVANIIGGMIFVNSSVPTNLVQFVYCCINSSGTPVVNANPIFELNATSQILLHTSTLECSNSNYVIGSGTVIRPSTNDSTNTNRGTNLMFGPGGVAGGVTVTSSNPWVSGSYKLV